MQKKTARPEGQTKRPTDAESAERLRGKASRLFVHVDGETWRDTETGAVGTRDELERAWLASLSVQP